MAEQNISRRSVNRLAPLTLMVVLIAGFLALTGRSQAAVTQVKGSAYGYEAQISLFGGVQPHDGPAPTVSLASDASNSPQTATAPSGHIKHGPANFFTADKLDASTQGTTGTSGSVTSTSNIVNVNRSAAFPNDTGSEIFSADTVHTTCTANESGVSGSATFAKADLQTDSGDDLNGTGGIHAPVHMAIPDNPPANGPAVSGHIHVNGSQDNFHVVFNEQTANSDGSITINAVHEFLDGPTAVGFLIIGQSVCGTGQGAGGTTTTTGAGGTNSTTTTTTTAAGGTTTTLATPVDAALPGGSTNSTPAGPLLSLSSTQLTPGARTTLTGSGLPANATLNLNFLSTPVSLGTVVTSATGGFQTTVTVPSNAAGGAHQITATDSGGRVLATVNLTVQASTASTVPALARTGTGIDDMALLALAVLLMGSLVLASQRSPGRRRR